MVRPRPLVLALLGALAVLVVPAPAQAATSQQRTWHGDQARIYTPQSAGRGGQGVVVAVLDSWVDAAHPDFSGRVLRGADCTGGTCRDGNGRDQCDHGTHVAGTVASTSFGVAPRATILPVRVLSYDEGSGECTGRPGDVAAGIRWAVSRGATVLNLSLGPDVPGLSGSSAIPGAVAEAARAGAVVVFSAGNASVPVTDSYDGNALIVAATGPSGRLASYSQFGSGVDLAAPGGDPAGGDDTCAQSDCVTSLYPGNRYAVAAGTSMAAPHVAGTAALLLGQSPGRGREDVVRRLTTTARPLTGAGSGSLDAAAALGVKATAAPAPTRAPAPVAVVKPRAKAPATKAPAVVAPAPKATRPATKAPAPPTPSPSSAAPSAAPTTAAPVVVEALPVSAPVEDLPRVPVGAASLLVLLAAGSLGGVVRTGRA